METSASDLKSKLHGSRLSTSLNYNKQLCGIIGSLLMQLKYLGNKRQDVSYMVIRQRLKIKKNVWASSGIVPKKKKKDRGHCFAAI